MARRHLTIPVLILAAILVWAVPSASAAPAWRQPIAGEQGKFAAVAMDASGDSFAAWSTASDVRFAIRPAGGTWQPSVQLSAAPANDTQVASGPQIATDAAGNVTVAWREQTGVDDAIKVATHSAGDPGIPTVQTVATNDYSGAGFSLEVAPTTGKAVIAYATSGRTVVVAIRPAAGQSFGAPEDPGVTAGGPIVDSPNAYILDDGTVGVVYSPNGDGVRAAVRDPAAGWDVEAVDSFFRVGQAAIALEPDGTALVAYIDGSNQVHVKTRPRGGDFGGAEGVNVPGTAMADFLAPLQLKLDATGNATIAWRQNDQVWVVDRPLAGPLGTPTAVGNGAAEYVRLALDSAGGVLVSWRGGTSNGYPSQAPGPILAAVRPAGGSFTSATQLAPDSGYAPAVAAGPPGSGTVIWGHAAGSGCTQIESSVLADGAQAALTGLAAACPSPPAPQTPPPGGATGGAATTDGAADNHGPRLKFSHTKQRFAKKGVISLRISCDENCSGVITAKIQHTPAKSKSKAKPKRMRVIRLSTAKFRVRGGHHTTIRYKLTAGQVTAIKKMLTKKGKATFVASVVASDAPGNRTRAKAKLSLVR
jgi:hypothetical protein